MDSTNDLPPITEDDIAQFLINTPDFFERHAELLATVQLTSPHSKRAVSLQERQAEMLREKIRHLELKAAEMIRHGHENVVIADKLQDWMRDLLQTRQPQDLPEAIADGLVRHFQVPQATLKLWGLAAEHAELACTQGVSADVQAFASSLTLPYCGSNPGLEAVQWLPQPDQAVSIALIPLRAEAAGPAFGLLVLASNDPQRFHASMGTNFLERMAELAAAALSRLRPAAH